MRNIVATPDGVAVATVATTDQGGRRRDLVTYGDAQQVHQFPDLPGAVRGFDDVAVDQDSARDGRAIVFAIDADSALVCSFRLSSRRQVRDGRVSMSLIGCSTQRVSVNPYVGIAAQEGTLVVSGGTGGVSIFRYNTSTGRLDDRPTIRNRDLGQVGHPGVTMISGDMAALCTDFRRSNPSGSSEFGVTIATINTGTRSVRDARFFRVPDTVGFDYAIQPANFPCDSSVYDDVAGGKSYLYVANGQATVQDPRRNMSPKIVRALPAGFEALAVDVNPSRTVAVYGGVIDNGRSSAYVILDISDPLDPRFVSMEVVKTNGRRGQGRITGVASAGRYIMYVFDDDDTTINRARIRNSSREAIQ